MTGGLGKRGKRARVAIAAAAVVAIGAGVLAGCSDPTEYTGPGSTVPADDNGLRPGETLPPKAGESAAPTTATTKPPTTVTTRAATTTTRQITEIRIQDDTQGKPFEPINVTTRAGRLVRWTNVGTTERRVIAENGQFRSPPIPPGGTYDWVAKPGSYNYNDGVRPYANGTLSVAG